MNKLNKSNIGLGEVRNRVVPSMEEYVVLKNKINSLEPQETIEGVLSTLSLDDNVYVYEDPSIIQDNLEDPLSTYVLELDNVKLVRISVDIDGKKLILTGGAQAKVMIFEFINKGDYDIQWMNLRVPWGMSPGLSPYTPAEVPIWETLPCYGRTLTQDQGGSHQQLPIPVNPSSTPPEEEESLSEEVDTDPIIFTPTEPEGPVLKNKTLYEIIRLGNDYYLTNILYSLR